MSGIITTKSDLIYVTDGHRHLICVPYSIQNLHRMAEELGIKRCWFHKNHYDIPQFMIEEVEKKCRMVFKANIVEIIQNPQYGEIILAPEAKGTAHPKDYFWKQEIEYNGFNKER